MRRISLLFGVVALLALTACSQKSEENIIPSPYYDPETNTVRTEFVLNVSTNTTQDTKTTAEFAQVNSDFLGMDAVHILSYNLPYVSEDRGAYFFKPYYTNPTTGINAPVAASKDFNLGMLFGANAVTSSNASRSVEMALPLETNAVVLYGKALKTYSDDLQGVTVPQGDPANLTTLSFSLKSRLSSEAAFVAGSYFFSRMLTYITTAGAVKEDSFWNYAPISSQDNSYHFWWPTPVGSALDQLPANPTDGSTVTVDGQAYRYYAGELSWKQLGVMTKYEYDGINTTLSGEVAKTENGTAVTLTPLGEVLGDAYNKLTVIKSEAGMHEIRAGSAGALLRTMQDLRAIVDRVEDSTPTSWEEKIAVQIADVIIKRMDLFFEGSIDGSIDFIHSGSAVDVASLKSTIANCTSTSDWNSYSSIVNKYLDASYFSSDDTNGFPINVGLPHGAAALTCTLGEGTKDVDVFNYTTDIPAYGMGDVTFPIGNYRYPAELMYFANSPIRVSNQEITSGQYPATVGSWDKETSWSAWDSYAAVKSDTRSVAMIDNVNYGTALLASTVSFGASTLKDNRHALFDSEEDQSIPTSYAASDEGFFVTGIIVGGQADVVGWDYVRKPSNTDYSGITIESDGKFTGLEFVGNGFDKMIYDKVTLPYKVGSDTEPIYTMLWDNYDHTKGLEDQSDVYVGVELVNKTGMDFWGELNLIRKGGTFYLVGKLDLKASLEAARSSDSVKFKDLGKPYVHEGHPYYNYPPYNPADGSTINAPRVFMQDYLTKANLIIGQDALKHAYVTVPDLRSSQVSLGVSIDMKWEAGLSFEVYLGQ